MVQRTEVESLASSIEARLSGCNALAAGEARLCAIGLRMLADNERLCEVAEVIAAAVGLPWHEPKVMRAAARIKLLFDSDLQAV